MTDKKNDLDVNTSSIKTLYEIVADRVSKGDIASVIVASRGGKTALEMAGRIKGVNVVSVTEFEYSVDVKKEMKKLGVSYVEKSDLPIQDREEFRDALLMFGAGVKSAVEIAVISAEKELTRGKVISVAGSEHKLDTALVIKPSKASEISSSDPSKRMVILELLAFSQKE